MGAGRRELRELRELRGQGGQGGQGTRGQGSRGQLPTTNYPLPINLACDFFLAPF
ncbi:hypothetical protein [Chroococcidiopsis cubana]|uniref:hypothetical protein n=1 Tax=Chroococcidiopsis cubana TaxID=171392 RepID=UPI002ACEF3B7|nr:hypothetical protein [Chroococcidiopsis cubana]